MKRRSTCCVARRQRRKARTEDRRLDRDRAASRIPDGRPARHEQSETAAKFQFSSSIGRELWVEDEALRHGVFTEALLKRLAGKADYSHDGTISITEMEPRLAERGKALTGRPPAPGGGRPPGVPNYAIAAAW